MPSSAPRTSCYSEDVRWLIVFKHLMGKTHAKIRRDLSVVDEHGHEWIPGPCGRTIDRILERYITALRAPGRAYASQRAVRGTGSRPCSGTTLRLHARRRRE